MFSSRRSNVELCDARCPDRGERCVRPDRSGSAPPRCARHTSKRPRQVLPAIWRSTSARTMSLRLGSSGSGTISLIVGSNG